MNRKYRVQFFDDSTWEVYSIDDDGNFESYFQGSLADCEAWIRLKEEGII